MSITEKLAAPFQPNEVDWRVGSTNKDKTKGMALAYLDARAVMDRLDEVCGIAGWQNKYSHANGKTVCDIGIKIDGEWIWKADGAGDTDFEAEKGALSDAFKRSAVRWGIGRYLYSLWTPWVQLVDGKYIADHEKQKLYAILDKDAAKVNGLSGLSKTPAKFWDKPKLTIEFTQAWVNAGGLQSQPAKDWWVDQCKKAIEKAPTAEHLARLQNDNQHIMDELDQIVSEGLRESFEIRAQQHLGA